MSIEIVNFLLIERILNGPRSLWSLVANEQKRAKEKLTREISRSCIQAGQKALNELGLMASVSPSAKVEVLEAREESGRRLRVTTETPASVPPAPGPDTSRFAARIELRVRCELAFDRYDAAAKVLKVSVFDGRQEITRSDKLGERYLLRR